MSVLRRALAKIAELDQVAVTAETPVLVTRTMRAAASGVRSLLDSLDWPCDVGTVEVLRRRLSAVIDGRPVTAADRAEAIASAEAIRDACQAYVAELEGRELLEAIAETFEVKGSGQAGA